MNLCKINDTMKKLFAFIAVIGLLFAASPVLALEGQDENCGNVVLTETPGADESVADTDGTAHEEVDAVEEVTPAGAGEETAVEETSGNKSFMERLIGFCLDNLNYGTVTLFMAIESSFIPFPSEAVVPPAAWKAATSGDMNVVLVVLFATLGALIGALINYYIAVWLGRPIVYKFANSRFGHMCLIDEAKVQKAETYFAKHGAVSTLIGRLVPVVRQLISLPAGLARMGIGRFVLYTTLGAAIWNVILASLGYYMSTIPGMQTEEAVMDKVKEYSGVIGWAFIGIALLVVGVIVYKGLKKNKK